MEILSTTKQLLSLMLLQYVANRRQSQLSSNLLLRPIHDGFSHKDENSWFQVSCRNKLTSAAVFERTHTHTSDGSELEWWIPQERTKRSNVDACLVVHKTRSFLLRSHYLVCMGGGWNLYSALIFPTTKHLNKAHLGGGT